MSFDRDGCPYQIGVVSWGDDCANPKSYGIYSRISSHGDWIRSVVGSVQSVAYTEVSAGTGARMAAADQALEALKDKLAFALGRVSLQTTLGDSVFLGDRYKFEVTSSIAGKLIIFEIDAAGEITQRFPYKHVLDTKKISLLAGQKAEIPGEGHGFANYKAAPPVGTNRTRDADCSR